MSEARITVRGLTRRFGNLTAISDLDLVVNRKQIYGFLGPNGCGKTTAIRMLTGLLSPSEGSIEVLGYQLPQDADKLRRKIGYMTQKFSLYNDLSVKENLEFIANIYGIEKAERKKRIQELLNIYGLEAKLAHLAGSMSGGQKQRLALAAATLHKPELLFLDEPTSAVDPENRRDFWEKLFDLCDQGASVLVSTHYMDEAERCHKLAILETGIKRADGTPDELMAAMDVNVIELGSNDLRRLKQALVATPDIISAAQLGARLRVLLSKKVADPILFIKGLPCGTLIESVDIVRPNLEDVFVTCTGGRLQ